MLLKTGVALYAIVGSCAASVIMPLIGLTRNSITYQYEVGSELMDVLISANKHEAHDALARYHLRRKSCSRQVSMGIDLMREPRKTVFAVVYCSMWPMAVWPGSYSALQRMLNVSVKEDDGMPIIKVKYVCRDRSINLPIDLERHHWHFITRRD